LLFADVLGRELKDLKKFNRGFKDPRENASHTPLSRS